MENLNFLNNVCNLMSVLSYEDVLKVIRSNDSAFRKRTKLHSAGGSGSKVYPPTYLNGKTGGYYAWEKRRIDGEIVTTVLLDSVQSQANRMEQALLAEVRKGNVLIPIIQVDFNKSVPEMNGLGLITTLDAPHRIADAIFRDSTIDGIKFRESNIGKEFTQSSVRNATGMLKWCPHALIFGIWDSTGAMGGLGNKFQRAITSEITGIKAEKGVHTSSRIDPLGITSVSDVYEDENGDWTIDVEKAKKNKQGKVVTINPSKIIHGNIPPTIEMDGDGGEPLLGGVTIDYALQTSVISLPALRRLRFPVNGTESSSINDAARALLASLALFSMLSIEEEGYDLRSGCLLIPDGRSKLEIISNDGEIKSVDLDRTSSEAILKTAINEAKNAGVPWNEEVTTLEPEEKLISLVRKSRTMRKDKKADSE